MWKVTLIDATVVAQLHVGGLCSVTHLAPTNAVMGHILLLLIDMSILRIFKGLNLFDRRELSTVNDR